MFRTNRSHFILLFLYLEGSKQADSEWSCWGRGATSSLCSALVPARHTLQQLLLPYSSPCPPCHSAILAVRVSATGVPAVPPSLAGCHCACRLAAFRRNVMQIGHWMCLTSPWPGRGAPAEHLCSLSSSQGRWEKGESLGPTGNMGNTGSKMVIF